MSEKPIGQALREQRETERRRRDDVERCRQETLKRQEEERLLPLVCSLYARVIDHATNHWDTDLDTESFTYTACKSDSDEAEVWNRVRLRLCAEAGFTNAFLNTDKHKRSFTIKW